MIVELDGPEPTGGTGLRDWLLPALVAFGCVSLLALAVVGESSPPAAIARPQTPAEPVDRMLVPVSPMFVPRPSLPPPLTFPSGVATLVSRSYFVTATGLISVDQLDQPGVRLVYDLRDMRRVFLFQVAEESIFQVRVDLPALEGPVVVRGQPGTALQGISSSRVSWREAGAIYRLFSTQLEVSELVRLADALR